MKAYNAALCGNLGAPANKFGSCLDKTDTVSFMRLFVRTLAGFGSQGQSVDATGCENR